MGMRLRELRHTAGLSQFKLAVKAGVSVDAVRQWEKGTRTPVLRHAAQLAGALGVTVGVLAGTEPMPAEKGKKTTTKNRKEN
jgi:transcriptional regulator with XRE-family HTH domain